MNPSPAVPPPTASPPPPRTWRQGAVRRLLGMLRRIAAVTARLRRAPRILLVCHNGLMAEALADVWHLLQNDGRLRFEVFPYLRPDDERPEVLAQMAALLPLPRVGRLRAHALRYDLILAADHINQLYGHHPDSPVVRITHGVGGNPNLASGRGLLYPGALAAGPTFPYARLLVNAQGVREQACRQYPGAAERFVVAGSLRDDRMLALVPRRAEVRDRLGINADEVAVLVMGAWGPHSLYHTLGEALLAALRKVEPGYRFLLTVHPNAYRPTSDGRPCWGRRLAEEAAHGHRVRRPEEPWEDYLVACDVVIADYTSLALRALLLPRPLIFSPLPPDLLDPQSLMVRLREISPLLNADASNLAACLTQARRDYPLARLAAWAPEVNSCPGGAAARIRGELYGLLGMRAKDSQGE